MTRHLAAAALALTLGCGDNAPTSDPPADAQADPGRVTLHRLNRTEYNNTVKDLLGVSLSPADQFPYDDIGDGFDNQADVLSLSPLQVELYQRAAEALVTEVLRVKASSYTREYGGDAFPTGAGVGRRGTYVVLATSQDLAITQTFSDTGRYRLSVQAYGDQGGPDLVRMALTLDGKQVQTFTVPNTAAAAGVF